ncbi:hypothetical protein LBMAG48_03000 [Phycisphaerae bacterium]|nr:hypothetical protein LBMAG48_03000 [Phycisphaerae bacterium]
MKFAAIDYNITNYNLQRLYVERDNIMLPGFPLDPPECRQKRLTHALDDTISDCMQLLLPEMNAFRDTESSLHQLNNIGNFQPNYSSESLSILYAAEFHARKSFDALCYMPTIFCDLLRDRPVVIDLAAGTGAVETAFRTFALASRLNFDFEPVRWLSIDSSAQMLDMGGRIRQMVFESPKQFFVQHDCHEGPTTFEGDRLLPANVVATDHCLDWRDASAFAEIPTGAVVFGANLLDSEYCDDASRQIVNLLTRTNARACAVWNFGSTRKKRQIQLLREGLETNGWKRIAIRKWTCEWRGELSQVWKLCQKVGLVSSEGMARRGYLSHQPSWGGRFPNCETAFLLNPQYAEI